MLETCYIDLLYTHGQFLILLPYVLRNTFLQFLGIRFKLVNCAIQIIAFLKIIHQLFRRDILKCLTIMVDSYQFLPMVVFFYAL